MEWPNKHNDLLKNSTLTNRYLNKDNYPRIVSDLFCDQINVLQN